jgi:hypothetical protein
MKKTGMRRICRTQAEMRTTHNILVERPEGKRFLGRFSRRWEDNIKRDLEGIQFKCVEWIQLAQDRDQ